MRPCTTTLRRVLLVMVVVVCLVASSPAEARAPPGPPQSSPSSSTQLTSSSAGCPRCPICSRRAASLRTRMRYCQPVTSRLFSRRWQRVYELPFATDADARRVALGHLNELLTSRVLSQPQVTSVLPSLLRRKLTFPGEPLVLHLAGDNGVGKTLTARLISQALSLRCGEQDGDRQRCESGDNLLTISGTGFDGLSREATRRHIVWRVVRHMESYPHGIVLIDDLTAMDPDVVAGLAPLFGRGKHFPEQLDPILWRNLSASFDAKSVEDEASDEAASPAPSYAAMSDNVPSLSNLLVVVTTDFGKQGRTVGKTPSEIDTMVRREFTHLYGSLLPAYTRTFTYLPFTEQTAEAIVRAAVADLPCSMLWSHGTRIDASMIDENAVAFLVERSKHIWKGGENGHALRRLVEDELVTQVLAYLDHHGLDRALRLHFVYDDAQAAVTLLTSEGHGSYLSEDL